MDGIVFYIGLCSGIILVNDQSDFFICYANWLEGNSVSSKKSIGRLTVNSVVFSKVGCFVHWQQISTNYVFSKTLHKRNSMVILFNFESVLYKKKIIVRSSKGPITSCETCGKL